LRKSLLIVTSCSSPSAGCSENPHGRLVSSKSALAAGR
jgi:hypothetical protein